MKYEKVIVKQIPDDLATLTGLHKYNRSKMPQTGDFLQAAVENGRAVTGIDEESDEINKIFNKEKREEAKAEALTLRQNLERLLGGKDLSATSSFWETFGVRLSSDSDLILNKSVALDVIRYNMLIANGYAAPDKDSTGDPQYRNAKYYCYVEQRANDEEISTQRIRDKARSELLKLSESDDRMVLIGQYLEGDKYKTGMRPNTLYKMLSDFINDVREPDNLKRFTKAVNTSIEDLQFKIIVDRAIKKKAIKFKDGYYQRGQVTLGKNALSVYENLKKPEFANEFLSLKEELE